MARLIPLTVVIPCYGREQKLARAVNSVLIQPVLPREIIIVDDGSPLPLKLPEFKDLGCHVKIIRLPVNSGAAEARNVGLQASKTDWVSFLDSDDWLLPNTMHLRWKFVSEEEMRAPLKGRTVYGCGWQDTLINGTVFRERTPYSVLGAAEYFRGCWFSPGSCVILNGREILQRAGKVDVNLRRLEDYEWFIRIGLAGFTLKVQDIVAVAIERGSNTNLEVVTTAAKLIRQRVWELTISNPERVSLRRSAEAYLLFEQAGSAWKEGNVRAFLKSIILSLLARPRFRIYPMLGWKIRFPKKH